MAIVEASAAYQLLRYDPAGAAMLDDMVREVADVLEVSASQAQQLVREVLDYYHYHTTRRVPSRLSREQFQLIVHVTQPLRIPEMTTRLDPLIVQLQTRQTYRTLLDYGGGGGKDSIIFARLGYQVTYADLLGGLTPLVRRRFALRQLEVRITDVLDLGEQRFDVINCLDVLEHIYDVEYALGDLMAHLRPGGSLLLFPNFVNSWDGDHIEKNCGYLPYFTRMLTKLGLQPVSPAPLPGWADRGRDFFRRTLPLAPCPVPMYHLLRARDISGTVAQEREAFARELYRWSQRLSTRLTLKSLGLLPLAALGYAVFLYPFPGLRPKGRLVVSNLLNNITDNLAIGRLSRQRLAAPAAAPPGASPD